MKTARSIFASFSAGLISVGSAACSPAPKSEDVALGIQFRIEGVADTWDLSSRNRGELVQVFLHDSPGLQVNLNVTQQKATVHFFFAAEAAENGPWMEGDLDGVEGLVAERGLDRVKVGALDLSRLRGGQDYELLINLADHTAGIEVFFNGTPQGDIFPANKGRWTPVKAERPERDVGGKLGEAEVQVLSTEWRDEHWSAKEAAARAGDLKSLQDEGRVVFEDGIDLDGLKLRPVVSEDFAEGAVRVIAEAALFESDEQGERRRVREPEAADWVLEGPGQAVVSDGSLKIENVIERTAAAARGHLVLWAPHELPDDFLLEYDFKPEDAQRGLHILFWNVQPRDGGSLFALNRRWRDGVFGEYLWRGINSYHASVFATDDNTPRRVVNLRKNNGFVLAACGDDRIAGQTGQAPGGAFRIRLLKVGARMTMEVDGVRVVDFEDDGRANGPVLSGGRLGFRIMAHTGSAEISRLRIFHVEPAAETVSGIERLLDYEGMSADGPPAGAEAVDGVEMRLVKDNALDAAGFWELSAPTGDDFAEARLPLPGSAAAGRYVLTLRARSAERKWLLAAMLDSGPDGSEREAWSHSEQLSGDLREYRYEAVLPASESERSLRLRFRAPGSVELASFRVERVDPERLITAAAARWPDGGPANLMRHSRLPLGLPAGWALDRHFDDEHDVVFTSDEAEPGVLRSEVAEGRRVILRAEPFSPALLGAPHVAGFRVKGNGRGALAVVADGRQVGEAVEFVAGADWTTVKTHFEAEPLAQIWYLRLHLEGDLYLDDFRVNDGESLRTERRAEVALSTGTRSRVHAVETDTENPLLQWAVSEAPAGARLVASVTNLYGETQALPPIALEAARLGRGELAYAVFPEKPYGVFRIEAQVEDADGQALGPQSEVVVHRIRRARYADDYAPDSPFGVHTLPTARHMEMAKAIGMNWVRLHDAGGLEWSGLEPEPGEWRFNDTTIRRYRAAKFEIFGVLGTSPLWANAWPGDKTPIHAFWDKWGAPGDLAAWANYVTKVTERYRDDIRVYEVWNEPWIPRFFSGRREPQAIGEPVYYHSETPQRDYAELSRATAEAVQTSGAGVRLVGLNSTAGEGISNRISGTEWAKGVAAEDGIQSMDIVSYHHYSTARLAYPGDDVELGLARALGPLIDEAGPMKPVWLTEGANTPGGLPGSFYNHVLPTEKGSTPEALAASADALVRYLVAMLAAGNERVFLYSMHTHGFFGDRLRFTTLVTPDGYLHPDAAAFAALAWQIEDRRLVSREATAEAVYFYFAGDDADEGVTVVAPLADRPLVPEAGAIDLWGNPANGRSTTQVYYLPGAN